VSMGVAWTVEVPGNQSADETKKEEEEEEE
jgi:hypothetical protein